ncbi:MAG: DNA-directed DNA polymerase alpha subunit pol12 [Caeruleum heppii]|nr:MAG: DNA-directed DNA polymerase alpha subunit pol12 [Caeruleum heppii]
MADQTTSELNALFAGPPETELPADIMGELQSMLRLHGIPPQELFYKWESYSMKMGSDDTKLDLPTVRAFKKDIQENLERELRGKPHARNVEMRGATGATPRKHNSNADVFGVLDGLVPSTPKPGSTSRVNGSSNKRRAGPETPMSGADQSSSTSSARRTPLQPPSGSTNGLRSSSFADRPNPGQILETLNGQIESPEPPIAPSAEPRVKLMANTDLKKFSYRPMAMHLSEASEVLDDRIDEFAALIQAHHSLPDTAFGNPASQSTNEIIAVGRIASDQLDSKLNAASLVLETSRRMGAGLRIPLRVDSVPAFEFFPGQIVALKGVNASGDYFSVNEILEVPLLPVPASNPATLDLHIERLNGGPDVMHDGDAAPLNLLLGSGPYTADDSLDFEPFHALCKEASDKFVDVLILTGPLLDLEHPLVATGDFDLPSDLDIDPDTVNLTTVFRHLIAAPLRQLAEAVPSITIIIIPSVRDAISKHVSWPQEPLPRKELGLPKQARLVSNPVTISLNEMIIGVSALDALSELRQEEVIGPNPKTPNMLARLPRYLLEQRHFYPLFPPVSRERLPKTGVDSGLATGAMLEPSYLKLGEWLNVRPDILITPSALPCFIKVVESVLVVNPGHLSKRKAAGTYGRLTVFPPKASADERAESKMVGHKVFERARVDIIKI